MVLPTLSLPPVDMPPAARAALSLNLNQIIQESDVEPAQWAYRALYRHLHRHRALPDMTGLVDSPLSPPGRLSKERRTSHSPRRGGASRASPLPAYHRRPHGSSKHLPPQEVTAFRRTMGRSRPRAPSGAEQLEEARHFPQLGGEAARQGPPPLMDPPLPRPRAVVPRHPGSRAISPEPAARRATTRLRAEVHPAPRERRGGRRDTPSPRRVRRTEEDRQGRGKRWGD